MTSNGLPDDAPRRPRVFAVDDPRLKAGVEPPDPAPAPPAGGGDHGGKRAAQAGGTGGIRVPWPTAAGVSGGVRFGAMFVSAVVALATLAATVSFFNFVSVALARDDWIGWTAAALLGIAALSGLVLIGREIMGLLRLGRLGQLRRDLEAAIADNDAKAERTGLARLKALYAARPEMRWPLARLAEHERDIHDPGALLKLADRELMAPLDVEARRMVLRSAKRVATVSALSPMALITVGYVLSENLGLLRRLAALYGGRPGVLGSLRLAKLVVGHLIGTGGVALTDDLLGQFLGQDILRRLSARLGEGAFNGALTARLGAAAIEVVRPLANIESTPVRARDILTELFKSEPSEPTAPPPSR
jgi:putative membrane protein